MIYLTSAPSTFPNLILITLFHRYPSMWGVPRYTVTWNKTTNLDPIWIKTLPSGIAVYQSVFKDIWGSDLIFAGPHKSFTNGNKRSSVSHVIFGIHYVISEHEDEQVTWADEREYAVVADSELLTVHPFPINPQDILDVGGEIEPNFEELVNSCNHVMEELDPTYSQHFCGVHKATLTITREVEELIEEECFKEIALLPEPLTLEMEIPGLGT